MFNFIHIVLFFSFCIILYTWKKSRLIYLIVLPFDEGVILLLWGFFSSWMSSLPVNYIHMWHHQWWRRRQTVNYWEKAMNWIPFLVGTITNIHTDALIWIIGKILEIITSSRYSGLKVSLLNIVKIYGM